MGQNGCTNWRQQINSTEDIIQEAGLSRTPKTIGSMDMHMHFHYCPPVTIYTYDANLLTGQLTFDKESLNSSWLRCKICYQT
jgi:hypothetical protein